MIPTTSPIDDLTTTIKNNRKLADQSCVDLITATPTLVTTVRHGSGQSAKVRKILFSCWNDQNPVNLCDTLSGLDTAISTAVIALITARARMGGAADDLIREIMEKSGCQPPCT